MTVESPWRPIETVTPEDSPILGWCDHKADPYQDPDNPKCITIYAAHWEGMSHVEDGLHVLEWGGAVDDHPDDGGAFIPDWWFLRGLEFEVAANPTYWIPIPKGSPP